MADRVEGYGLTKELEDKKNASYDPSLAQETIDWINAVLQHGGKQELMVSVDCTTQENVCEALKNGRVLCEVINVIQPGSVKKINTGAMAFKLMENIGNFLTGCEGIKCQRNDLFQTIDLYEGQNIPQVIRSLQAVGRKAQDVAGYSGPSLGKKESQANPRQFTEEQMKAGQGIIGLQMGTNKLATQSGQNFGKARHIID